MRILHAAHHFLPRHRAGVEIYTDGLAREQTRQGHDVLVATTEDGSGRPAGSVALEDRDGLAVAEISHPRIAELPGDTLGLPPVQEAFEQILDLFRPDVVHFQHLMYLGLDAPSAVKRRGIPAVMTLHEYWLLCARGGQMRQPDGTLCEVPVDRICASCLRGFRFGRTRWETRIAKWCARLAPRGSDPIPWLKSLRQRLTLRRRLPDGPREDLLRFLETRRRRIAEAAGWIDRFLAPSRFLKERFAAAGWPPDRIQVSPYGIPPGDPQASRRSTRSLQGPLRVGFLGSFVPQKGARVLAEAHLLLPPGTVRVSYHGNPRSDPGFSRSLKRLARRGESFFRGPYEPEGVLAILDRLDVVVVPSLWFENAPVVISEAFRSGVPVVASRLGGMAEMVRDGIDGRLFNPGDPQDLARILLELHGSPDRLRLLDAGIAAPRTVADDAGSLLELYRELLAVQESSHGRKPV